MYDSTHHVIFCCSTLWSSACYRFVSDNAYNSYKAVCQHKLIQAMQKSLYGPETARTYPLSLLEWTANRKKANMVLQVHCFDGENNIYSLTSSRFFSRFLKENIVCQISPDTICNTETYLCILSFLCN